MNRSINPKVTESLRSVGRRWKWLYFWRLLSGLAIGFAVVWLLLGVALERAWITSAVAAAMLCVALVFGIGVGLFVVAILATVHGKPDSWLAREMEKRAPRLRDRVNTLVFLKSQRLDRVTGAYFEGINRQASKELVAASVPNPIPWQSTAVLIVAALLTVWFTVGFYRSHEVWKVFGDDEDVSLVAEDTLELDLPEDDAAEMRSTWGEIRITEPGGDLKLTKVDVLPLTVEAASSQQLQRASWSAAVNGGKAANYPLPAPQEPNYAVYEPVIYLDEHGLSDWDVLSYFADASAEGDGQFASEIYFVEIRPFQSDLLLMEGGGGGGEGMQCLNKLGGLIRKEQDVLRQTFRQDQKAASDQDERARDQEKLVAAQAELETATGHLYAEVAELENQGVATVLNQLALAQDTMKRAVAELQEPDNPGALGEEQLALQQLVESRKDLVKIISEGSGDGSGSGDEDKPPVAGMDQSPEGHLEDIEDIRDEGKAALDAVRELQEKQAAIAKDAVGADTPEKLAELAARQKEAAKGLSDIREKVPQPFSGVEDEANAAQAAMDKAGTMEDGATAQEATGEAVDVLGALSQQMESQQSRQALGDAYRLKNLMDSQSESMTQMGEKPQEFSEEDFKKAAAAAKSTKEAMEKTLQDTPAGKAFGPELAKALAGEPGQNLDQAAGQMAQSAGDSAAAGEGAAQAGQSMAEIAKAFESSLPPMLQGEAATAQPGGESSGVGSAMRMLNSLVQRMSDHRETDPEAMQKQIDEARLMILSEAEKAPEDAPALMAIAGDLAGLKETVNIEGDVEAFRKLMDRLESYRLELADKAKPAPDDPQLLHADPATAPAEFRERVRRYFEKLSDG